MSGSYYHVSNIVYRISNCFSSMLSAFLKYRGGYFEAFSTVYGKYEIKSCILIFLFTSSLVSRLHNSRDTTKPWILRYADQHIINFTAAWCINTCSKRSLRNVEIKNQTTNAYNYILLTKRWKTEKVDSSCWLSLSILVVDKQLFTWKYGKNVFQI